MAHNGARLGALCLLDTQPRTFSGHDCLILCMLAELAVREMERRWRDAHPVSLWPVTAVCGNLGVAAGVADLDACC